MDYLKTLPLSAAGSAVLEEDEAQLLFQQGVGLYDGERKTRYTGGLATITTHRLLWRVEGDPKQAFFLALQDVADVSTKDSLLALKASPKIVVSINPPSSSESTAATGPSPSSSSSSSSGSLAHRPFIKLAFRSGGRDSFLAQFRSALQKKAWEEVKKTKNAVVFATSTAGVGGLMRRQEHQSRQTNKELSAAFQDLDSLMEKAREMVSLSDKIATRLAAAAPDDRSEGEENEFDSLLLNLGILSPVTKETAGAVYHKELARQLADFLIKPLTDAGGMLDMAETFCLVNRARGTDLVSPEDMLQAFHHFLTLKLPLRVRKFPSGVTVVELASRDGAKASERIVKIVDERKRLSALDLSALDHISLTIAKEQLMECEACGLLCRDETIEALYFYKNLFMSM